MSPVADVLREKLATVNWARAGLGLPLVSIALIFLQALKNVIFCYIMFFFFYSLAMIENKNWSKTVL